MTREERKTLRVQCSMLHRQANQLQDMPDAGSKILARKYQLEAEQVRQILELDRKKTVRQFISEE